MLNDRRRSRSDSDDDQPKLSPPLRKDCSDDDADDNDDDAVPAPLAIELLGKPKKLVFREADRRMMESGTAGDGAVRDQQTKQEEDEHKRECQQREQNEALRRAGAGVGAARDGGPKNLKPKPEVGKLVLQTELTGHRRLSVAQREVADSFVEAQPAAASAPLVATALVTDVFRLGADEDVFRWHGLFVAMLREKFETKKGKMTWTKKV